MKISEFLDHHGIARNPFAEEDAQTDAVFKEHCIDAVRHPIWDKVYGDPKEPSTAIVLGEKGAGKTAMRLQITRSLEQFNEENPGDRVFVIQYDDFNPFLDRFADTFSSRRRNNPAKVLGEWKLWDHMDAILTLGVTKLVDSILGGPRTKGTAALDVSDSDLESLDTSQARDLLLLSAFYDQSLDSTFRERWTRLRRRIGFSTWRAHLDAVGAAAGTVAVSFLLILVFFQTSTEVLQSYGLMLLFGYIVTTAIAWSPWTMRWFRRHTAANRVVRRMRTGNRDISQLRKVLMELTPAELASQPMPDRVRSDDRYELLMKLQGVLSSLGYKGVVVIVDRLDEPHLVNGSAEMMKALLWPLLDNKFLKHPGLGIKMMLPIELSRFIEREDRDFYQRARLDKQNLIPAFEWTSESLHDVANARISACANEGSTPQLRNLFDETISDTRLLEAFRSLRAPRRLFKFLHRLLVQHCNSHLDSKPEWEISPATFEATLAVDLRDQDAFDRGVGAGA